MRSRKSFLFVLILALVVVFGNVLYSVGSATYIIDKTTTSFTNVQPYKFEVGDKVSCSKWKNGSYWKGKVIERKDGLYKIRISEVRVEGFLALHLNANPCTGNKRLSFENGDGYHKTEIWVLEVCLDGTNKFGQEILLGL